MSFIPMESLKFTFKGEFSTMNEQIQANRTHWSKGSQSKKLETEYVAMELLGKENTIPYPLFIQFSWYCKNKRKDPDNIANKKSILDGMQKAGFIENDGWKQICGFCDRFYVDKENPRVEVDIYSGDDII